MMDPEKDTPKKDHRVKKPVPRADWEARIIAVQRLNLPDDPALLDFQNIRNDFDETGWEW